MVAANHGTDEVVVRVNLPSPALVALTIWTGPFAPCAVETTMAVWSSRNCGAACRTERPAMRNPLQIDSVRFAFTKCSPYLNCLETAHRDRKMLISKITKKITMLQARTRVAALVPQAP